MKPFIILNFVILLILCSCEKNQQAFIAIITPTSHPSLEIIEKGFIQTIEAQQAGKYRFKTYNAQGNKTLMRSEIEEIMQQKPKLVFTIGATASQMTVECFRKKNIEIPIVFTCVNDPMGFQIISSKESNENHVTGIKELLDLETEIAILLKYKPHLKNILLVYNPAEPGLQKDHAQLQQILQQKHIEMMTVEVFQTNELQTKITPFISKADAMLVLKDNTVIAGLEILVKLCNRYHVPLMASDLDSPDKGAAFGYGVHEIDFGIEGAQLALKILEQDICPYQLPINSVSNFDLKINSEAAQKQGIHLSQVFLQGDEI